MDWAGAWVGGWVDGWVGGLAGGWTVLRSREKGYDNVLENLGAYTYLKVTLFLKSLDHKNLPHAPRVSHDILSLLRSSLSSRSLLLCVLASCATLFSPEQ